MFTIDADKTISITRGDSGSFVAPIDYALQPGDVLRLKVFRKKACEDVVMQKDFAIGEATETVSLELTENDTRIGEIISKPVDYWYEIELNPDNNPQTIVGYDEDGAKVFRLYPEGRDLEDSELTEEEKDTLRKYLDEFKNEINVYLEKEVENMQSYLDKEIESLQGGIDIVSSLIGGGMADKINSHYGVDRGKYPYIFITYSTPIMNVRFLSNYTFNERNELHATGYLSDTIRCALYGEITLDTLCETILSNEPELTAVEEMYGMYNSSTKHYANFQFPSTWENAVLFK